MLDELFIKNFLFIKESLIKLKKGLITVTGETGSGKSLFLSSIYYLFGGKLKSNIIMRGENECLLFGKFKPNKETVEYLNKKGIFIEEFITIKRIISLKKDNTFLSNYYINNKPVSNSLLRSIFGMLIDIHSQNQQYLILKNPLNNLKILDNYAGIRSEVEEYKIIYENYIKELDDYNNFLFQINDLNKNLEDYKRVLSDINKINPKLEEEGSLKNRINEIKNYESLKKALLNLKSVLTIRENFSALGEIKKVIRNAEYLSNLDKKYKSLKERLESVYYELEDIGFMYEKYLSEINYDETELEDIESRLYLLSRLKKKYGPTLGEVIKLKEKYETFINNFIDFSEKKLKREKVLNDMLKKIKNMAFNLSKKRKKSALEFGLKITEILHKLNMLNSEFLVKLSNSELNSSGIDTIEFFIKNNLSVKAEPVHQISSGGELSRIVLAIKSVENLDEDKLVIFDEIDSGVGGESGVKLSRYLKNLSKNVQLLVITHLASIASIADFHILVKKKDIFSKTYIKAFLIDKKEKRILEIARMLSGEVNEASIFHAKKLLNLH